VGFGHPENSFTYKWNCEKCGSENSCEIEEWVGSKGSQNHVQIFSNDRTAYVRIFCTPGLHEVKTIPLTLFEWRDFEDELSAEYFGQYLTLEDISDQLKQNAKSEYIGIVYLWTESPLYGAIYQYGNYDDDIWHLCAKTNGYA